MRYVITLTVLAFLAAVPARAQQETGQQKTSAPTTTEQMSDEQTPDADDAFDARIGSDWSKIQSHWDMVKGMKGPEKAEHLEMHRAMLADLMKELDEHQKIETGKELPDAEDRQEAAALADAQEHWQMVQSIKDPQQLETHLKLHMGMLAPIVAEAADYDDDEDDGMSGMDHGDMDHGGMDHGANPEPVRPPAPEKPAGY
jgi:hypothetical protein